MKNLVLLSIITLILFACGEDDIVSPQSQNCNLMTFTSKRLLPSSDNYDTNYTYHGNDSIVGITNYTSSTVKTIYIFNNNNNTVDYKYIKVPENDTTLYGTYYLDESGFIDSFIRKSGITDDVNYRYIVKRNSKNQITNELTSYITYGYDRQFFYDEDGNYTYVLEQGQGSQTHDDSLVYEYDMNHRNNGAPTYLFEELNGKKAAYHITNIKYIKRSNEELRRENRYRFDTFDDNGNPTMINYQIDNSPDEITFNADYSYDRTYEFYCN